MNAPTNINQAALCNIELEQEVLGAALISSSFEVIERAVFCQRLFRTAALAVS